MTNPFPLPDSARTALLKFAFDALANHMSNAGSNDMDQSVFSALSNEEKLALYAGFLKWELAANPKDWEPTRFEFIPDFLWVAYLRSQMERQ